MEKYVYLNELIYEEEKNERFFPIVLGLVVNEE